MRSTMAFLWIYCLLLLVKRVAATEHHLGELEAYLQKVNPPSVQDFKLSNGDTVACVPLEGQLSLIDAGKDHVMQMAPSAHYSVKNNKEWGDQLFAREAGSCQQGTIPVLRISPELAAKHISLQLPRKRYSRGNQPPDPFTHEHAFASLGGTFTGMQTTINMWEPYVERSEEFSLSQLWAISQKQGLLNTIEAGWQVYPDLYKGEGTRLFVYWTADNYDKTGCYNLMCKGFVQVSNKVVLGGSFGPVSKKGDTQYEHTFLVFQDNKTSNWWLRIDGTDVGYWPSSLFSSLQRGFETLEVGGEVYYDKGRGRHTKTAMGSGEFPDAGQGKAAYHAGIQYLGSDGVAMPATGLQYGAEAPSCYTYGSMTDQNRFFFGGPGYSAQCP